MRRTIQKTAFELTRRDVAMFLRDHEEDLLAIFREEMHRLDEEIPEERLFIDIKMVPLGEAIMKSTLQAIIRFLLKEFPATIEEEVPSDLPDTVE